ncbi:ABC transporter substrate-binding protein [Leucobacter chromiireducens]|uniref:ABC transporter substrate-binding protein n=1 Tax=Leucobacter chromiireducens TaxID=283877 RepID=UPI001925D059
MLARRRTSSALLASAAALTLLLSGCAPSSAAPVASDHTTTDDTAGFPRTIEIPGAHGTKATSLTLEAAPETIAALDYESAEVLAELGLAEHLVLVPEAVLNPALGGHIDELSAVPEMIPVAMELDPETVIALDPDLVVMSPRHGAESRMGGVFAQAGVPTLQLPDSWTGIPELTANIELIGEATGADDTANALAKQLETGLASSATPSNARVLVLSNQAGRPFVTAGNAFPLRLLELTGAQDVSAELGITATGPISAEQIIEANPDGILLVDMNGSGERLFSELLKNPAVAALTGAEHTLLVTGREVQALGLSSTVDGLATLTQWVATLDAP